MSDRDHIIVRPYDTEAPAKFAAAKAFLLELIPFPIGVEHMGSSSVPGLGGKRVIDVMVLCEQPLMRKVVSHLEDAGYKFKPEEGFGIFPERFFISGWFPYKDGAFHVHYHITFPGSSEHRDKLGFRDRLRGDPEIARRYFELKKAHCIVDGDNVTFLPIDKTPFIREVLGEITRPDDP